MTDTPSTFHEPIFSFLRDVSRIIRYTYFSKLLATEMLLKIFNYKILVQLWKSVNNLKAIPHIP